MDREQTTIRLPAELMEQLKQEAERKRESKKMTIRVPQELYKELEIMSKQTGLTVTSLLIAAIWQSVLKLKY